MASTALPHEPAGSRCSAKIRVNWCAQGVLIATPSRVAKLHRHQVGFDLRELLIGMARYLQRHEHLVIHERVRPHSGRVSCVARRQPPWPRSVVCLPLPSPPHHTLRPTTAHTTT